MAPKKPKPAPKGAKGAKPAVKKVASQPAKQGKPAPKAVKSAPAAARKAPPKAAAKTLPKPVEKPVAKPAPVTSSIPSFWQAPEAPAPLVLKGGNAAWKLPTAWLTFGYVWRVWFLAFVWLSFFQLAIYLLLMRFNPMPPVLAGGLFSLNVVMGIALNFGVVYWLCTQKKLLGNIGLNVQPAQGTPRGLALTWVWIGLFWRNFVLGAAFFGGVLALGELAALALQIPPLEISELILKEMVEAPPPVVPVLTLQIADGLLGLYVLLNLVAVPFLGWAWLLKKRTFRWGKLELNSLKG